MLSRYTLTFLPVRPRTKTLPMAGAVRCSARPGSPVTDSDRVRVACNSRSAAESKVARCGVRCGARTWPASALTVISSRRGPRRNRTSNRVSLPAASRRSSAHEEKPVFSTWTRNSPAGSPARRNEPSAADCATAMSVCADRTRTVAPWTGRPSGSRTLPPRIAAQIRRNATAGLPFVRVFAYDTEPVRQAPPGGGRSLLRKGDRKCITGCCAAH